MNIEITRLNVNDYGKWDKLLEKSPQSEIYHTTKWLRIAEKHTGTELFLLLALMDSEIIGGIPLFLHRSYRGLFKRLMSPPYPSSTQIFNLGPVFTNYDELKSNKRESRLMAFQSSLDEYIYSKIKPDYMQLITTTNLLDIRSFQWSGYNIIPAFTYIGNIKDKESSWRRLEKETRRDIVKAEKRGIELEEGGLEEYKSIYRSYVERHTEKEINFNVSWQYLLDVFKEFYPKNLKILIAKHRGEVIGGHINLLFKDKIVFWLGGVRSNIRGVYPNRFMTWKTIEWARDQSYRYYEDVGANHPSISVFKSKFGFDLKIYFYISKSSRKYKIYKKLISRE